MCLKPAEKLPVAEHFSGGRVEHRLDPIATELAVAAGGMADRPNVTELTHYIVSSAGDQPLLAFVVDDANES
jgi:hypothetical protein